MIDFDALVIAPLMGVFGQPFVITPVVSMPGTSAYTATGVWSSPTREIALENGGVLSTNEFHLGIRVADFTVLPQQEDQITFGVTDFIVGDVLLDGQGGADLILRQVPQ